MKLHIIVDLDDNLDSTLIDPHTMADELLDDRLPVFRVNFPFAQSTDIMPTRDGIDTDVVSGTFVSAEWDS